MSRGETFVSSIRTVVGAILSAVFVLFLIVVFMVVSTVFGVVESTRCLQVRSDPFNSGTVATDSKEAEAYFALFSPGERKERLDNARIIAEVGVSREESFRNISIAIAVAIQETNLKNYGHLGAFNDHDSCGVYQQQWTQGWGESCAQLMDVTFAATQFYNALDKVSNADSMSMMDVGIAVQNPSRAAYKSRWAWDDIATQTAAMFVDPSLMQGGCYAGMLVDGWRVPLDSGYTVGDGFGWRESHPVWGDRRFHYGLDFGMGGGEPIYASGPGRITFVGYNGGWGNQVQIDHGGGVVTTYAHLSRFADVREGQQVTGGQVIGYIGRTGTATGNHLHFEVFQDGENIDPEKFLNDLGLKL